MELPVIADTDFNPGLLVVVTDGDFLLYERNNLIFFQPEEGRLIHIEGLFQGSEFIADML